MRPARSVRCGTVVLSSDSTITGKGLRPVFRVNLRQQRAVRTARSIPSSIASSPASAIGTNAPASVSARRPRSARKRRRVGRQESPVAQLGAGVSRRRHLVEHLRGGGVGAAASNSSTPQEHGAFATRITGSRAPAAARFPRRSRRLDLTGRRDLGNRHIPPRLVAADAGLAVDRDDDDRGRGSCPAARAPRGVRQGCRRESRARPATRHWPRDRPATHRRRARRLPHCDTGTRAEAAAAD